MSSSVVSPWVTQARMISLPSNDATATHARPEARTLATIDRTSPKPGGGWRHNTPSCEELAIDHPRGHQLIFEQVGQFDRSFHVLRIATPSGRCERQEHAQAEESPRPLN